MSAGTDRLIAYPEERALEDTAYGMGLTPTLLFAVLFPVWSVEVQADVTEGEPYELIDRYLTLALAQTGLCTAGELADLLCLEPVLVDRALRFLRAIGHLDVTDDRYSLTELGFRSVKDRVRYVVTREDRRKLYFDAFRSRPLTRPYYESRTVSLLSEAEALTGTGGRGPRFQLLTSLSGFDPRAIASLAAHPERDRFNLPERIDAPRMTREPELRYLPMYLVRAVADDGRPRLLAYTQLGATADEDISSLWAETPELGAPVDSEAREVLSATDGTRFQDWLHRNNLGGCRPERRGNGTWRVTVPAEVFGRGDRNGVLPLSKLGSFVMQGSSFFHVWCRDEPTRRRALLRRADEYLGARSRVDWDDAERFVAQLGKQLELGDIDLGMLLTMAQRAGRRGLAAQLSRRR